ncbi:MAG: alpha/beta hydrolase, partial [Gemmatimonadetes bacterium]|nr:alpha/beta hydrolase [Gemmatimonadota bacterium]
MDVPYASVSSAQRLDLFLPSAGEGPFPLIIWIHGGGWRSGDKRFGGNAFQLRALSEGYAVASLNYRLSGEASHPAQIHDVKTAIRWLREHRKDHRLKTKRVGVWGSSAGGHLVSLLGTSGGVASLEGSDLGVEGRSSRVQAVVDWYGPTDLNRAFDDLAAQGCPTGGAAGAGSTIGLFLGASPQE